MAKNLLHENMMIISNMFNIKIIKVEEAKIFVLRIFRSATILLIEMGRLREARVISKE